MKLTLHFNFDTHPRGWWTFSAWRGPRTRCWFVALHFLRHFEIYIEGLRPEED